MTKDLGVWTADDCALVLIDYQKEMFEVIRSETSADLVEMHVRLLAKTAKAFDVPIVRHDRGRRSRLQRADASVDPGRARRDRADRPVFDERVRGRGVQRRGEGDRAQATDHRRTPHGDLPHVRDRQALKDGYDVMYVADAVGGRSQAAHRTAIERLAHAGAVPTTALAVDHRDCSATGRARCRGRPSTPSTGTSARSRSLTEDVGVADAEKAAAASFAAQAAGAAH